MTEPTYDHHPARMSRWMVAAEIASLAVAVAYLWICLYPDETEREMRGWSLASRSCYGVAELLGRAGMACERHYSSLTGGA